MSFISRQNSKPLTGQLTFAMEDMEMDTRFEKNLNLLQMTKKMHKNLITITFIVALSPSFYFEQLVYTVLKAYQNEERDAFFEEDDKNNVMKSDNTAAYIHRSNKYEKAIPQE